MIVIDYDDWCATQLRDYTFFRFLNLLEIQQTSSTDCMIVIDRVIDALPNYWIGLRT